MNLHKNDLIEIEWVDAHDTSDWLTEEEAKKRPPEIDCKSVGYYLRRDKELIYISSSIGKMKKGERDRKVIPRGMIKRIRKLYRRK